MTDTNEPCGMVAIYTYGRCVLPKGHKPEAQHRNKQGDYFTRAWTVEDALSNGRLIEALDV